MASHLVERLLAKIVIKLVVFGRLLLYYLLRRGCLEFVASVLGRNKTDNFCPLKIKIKYSKHRTKPGVTHLLFSLINHKRGRRICIQIGQHGLFIVRTRKCWLSKFCTFWVFYFCQAVKAKHLKIEHSDRRSHKCQYNLEKNLKETA